MGKQVELRLSARERELILQYGYPFDGIEGQLSKHVNDPGLVRVSDDVFWWEQVAGQLAISLNKEIDPRQEAFLWDEINEVAECVENAVAQAR